MKEVTVSETMPNTKSLIELLNYLDLKLESKKVISFGAEVNGNNVLIKYSYAEND